MTTTTIDVTITPTGKNGNDVDCDITGTSPYVLDNAIVLPTDAGDFAINFNLVPGPGGTYSWDSAGPFGNDTGKCPKGKGSAKGQFTFGGVNGNTMTVNASQQSQPSVVHYRLNFQGGSSCDPIIINGLS